MRYLTLVMTNLEDGWPRSNCPKSRGVIGFLYSCACEFFYLSIDHLVMYEIDLVSVVAHIGPGNNDKHVLLIRVSLLSWKVIVPVLIECTRPSPCLSKEGVGTMEASLFVSGVTMRTNTSPLVFCANKQTSN